LPSCAPIPNQRQAFLHHCFEVVELARNAHGITHAVTFSD
jgi:hypothetical protein